MLRILQSLWPPDNTTQYIDLLIGGATQSTVHIPFSWKTALVGRYDILHVHWPEMMIRAERPVARFLRRRALDLLLLREWATKTAVVRTVHNIRPHEQGDRHEQRSIRRLDRATTLYIRLNVHTPVASVLAPVVTIPHAHYRPALSRFDRPGSIRGRVAFIGIVRPYKGVLKLISAFQELPDSSLSLRIVGAPSAGQGSIVADAASADPRITVDLRFVSDEQLVREICEAEIVVFPYLEMHNSGAVLAALSVDRPVLVPRTRVNEDLQNEVGEGWVHIYDNFSASALHDAIASVRASPGVEGPNLGQRDWPANGAAHLAAYKKALAIAQQR